MCPNKKGWDVAKLFQNVGCALATQETWKPGGEEIVDTYHRAEPLVGKDV